jgi:hypothetical protein
MFLHLAGSIGLVSSYPYEPGGYGPPPGPPGPPPPNHLVWAILTTIFCCLPAGVVSIIYAAQVNSKWQMGDQAGAMNSSRNARRWAIISAVIWLALVLLGGLIALLAQTGTNGGGGGGGGY